jgi:proteasome accessory factor C
VAETSRDRLVRMLGMVAYLEAHGATPIAVLAEHFGVSPAKATQELWTLGMSGVPPYLPDEYIDFDFDALDNGLAVLRDAQGVTQVRLSGQEAVALTGALATLIAAGTAPSGADRLLERIGQAFGAVAPVTVLAGGESVDSTVRDSLTSAIGAEQAVRVVYVDAQDRRTERVIEPHRLVAIDGVGYVECWCRKAEDYRTLRLSRFEAAQALEDPVVHPPTTERGFTLDPQFHASVELERAARWAFEDIAGVEIEDNGDTATVRFGVSDPAWVAARLLSVAPHLISVEPASLRNTLARHADAVLAAHAD